MVEISKKGIPQFNDVLDPSAPVLSSMLWLVQQRLVSSKSHETNLLDVSKNNSIFLRNKYSGHFHSVYFYQIFYMRNSVHF